MGLKRSVDKWMRATMPKTRVDLDIARRSKHFEPEYWLLPKLCDRRAVSVDVGGNSGLFAYYMAKLSRSVHVFEPNPTCLAEIARLKTRNMLIHGVALSDAAGRTRLRFDPNNTGVGTVEDRNLLDNNPGIHQVIEREVELKRLDDFGLEDVAFIKVDVEGHEPSVIRGAMELVGKCRPPLLIESERRHNATAFEELLECLEPLGYGAFRWTGSELAKVVVGDLDRLQDGRPESNPEYVNNFLFLTEDGKGLLGCSTA